MKRFLFLIVFNIFLFCSIDFTNDTGNPVDVIGHGTHVSGTIAATANDENPHVGVAFDAVILPCKLGDYGMYQSAQIKAIQFCVDQGVRIANCSFGGYGASQAVFDVMQKAGVDGDMIFLICMTSINLLLFVHK